MRGLNTFGVCLSSVILLMHVERKRKMEGSLIRALHIDISYVQLCAHTVNGDLLMLEFLNSKPLKRCFTAFATVVSCPFSSLWCWFLLSKRRQTSPHLIKRKGAFTLRAGVAAGWQEIKSRKGLCLGFSSLSGGWGCKHAGVWILHNQYHQSVKL